MTTKESREGRLFEIGPRSVGVVEDGVRMEEGRDLYRVVSLMALKIGPFEICA
jgi:hypothetical protein